MDLPPEVDNYILGSIEHALNIPVSNETLHLKLFSSEDARRRLQDLVFLLEDRLQEANLRVKKSKAEASMSASGLKRCIEEKEVLCSRYATLSDHCAKLEKECLLYTQDIERLMESCDELGKENEELMACMQAFTNADALHAENECLKKDKELLRINLLRAEEEAKVLFDENKVLDKENKWLLKQLNNEKNERTYSKQNHEAHSPASKNPVSANGSTKGKRKSSMNIFSIETATNDVADSRRHPLSDLHQNSPEQRRQKK